jgi:hypothetical protein
MMRELLIASVVALAGSAYADCGADHGAGKQDLIGDTAPASRAPVIAQAPAKAVKATPKEVACTKGNCDTKTVKPEAGAKPEKLVRAD